MKRIWWRSLCVLGALLPVSMASVAPADTTIFVKGDIVNIGNFGDTGVKVGDTYKVTFTVRPLQAGDDLRGADGSIGEYADTTQPFTIDVGGGKYTITCEGTRIFMNNNVSNTSQLPPDNDRITLRGIDCTDSRGEVGSDTGNQVQLVDSTGTAVGNDLLTDANVAAIVDATDIVTMRAAAAGGVSLNAAVTKISDKDPGDDPVPGDPVPPAGLLDSAKAKLSIKKVVKDKGATDYAIELLENGTFLLEPAGTKWSILNGTWTDKKGKGKDYSLTLDASSQDELLEDLTEVSSDASGENQTVSYKGGKPPKLKLTRNKKGKLDFSMKAKVQAESESGKVRKGTFKLKGAGAEVSE